MAEKIGWFHTYTVLVPLYKPGYQLPEHISESWMQFGLAMMQETPSLIGMAYMGKYGAMSFTFGKKDDAFDFLEGWREAFATGIWPFQGIAIPEMFLNAPEGDEHFDSPTDVDASVPPGDGGQLG